MTRSFRGAFLDDRMLFLDGISCATDKATVDRYLSYISYEQYKEENPDKF